MVTPVKKNHGGKTDKIDDDLAKKRCQIKWGFCLALIIALVLVSFSVFTIAEVTEVYSELGYLG